MASSSSALSSTFLLLLLLLPLLFSLVFSSPKPPLPYKYKHVCNGKLLNVPYCDKSLPYHVRAKHLVDSMLLSEKVKQLGNSAAGVDRLGIPPYNWWSEALHGVSYIGDGSSFDGPLVKGATSFPLPISTAAAFNQSLWKNIGQVVSTEARAMNNLGVAGLTFWSPNINLVRDPRWGRALETSGEDPVVAGLYAANYVRGLQDVEGPNGTNGDPNARPLKVSACCKHYAAYDIDLWRSPDGSANVDRFHYDAKVTERDMIESYLKPFEMCVKEGDVSSVMCSYNKINGVPACADARLLRGIIRNEWNLHGYIVSDCDSIKTMVVDQKFLDETVYEGAAHAMRAGLDLNCGSFYPDYLEGAVLKGLIKESDVDQALINNYIVLLRLGWFDGNPSFDSLNQNNVCSKDNIRVATDAARQGMVLLKNKNNALPLNHHKFKKITVVGPHANATEAMLGNYRGVPCRYTSPVDGFKKYADVDYKQGCEDVACHNEMHIFHAMMAATEADATVIAVGLNLMYEAEDLDRSDFSLPGYQEKLIQQVSYVAKGPVILVVFSSGTIDITKFLNYTSKEYNSDYVDAIIWAGYPGQEGGQAIADVVYGAYNPAGRLPVTWYRPEYLWNLPMTSQQFRPNDELKYPGRTYKFFNGNPLFPFGSGLSYTQFTYSFNNPQNSTTETLGPAKQCFNGLAFDGKHQDAKVSCQAAVISDIACSGNITVEVVVTNAGKLDGGDVVMLYARHPDGLLGAPIKHLVAFQRVFVKAGASKTVKFELNACKSLVHVTEAAYEVLPQGWHVFMVGDKELPINVIIKKEN